MRIKNGKSVKIISFAKKEEQPIQFVDVQVGQVRQDRQQIQFVDVQVRQVRHLENGQMGQKEETQPKVIHLEKGQSDIGQLKYGQSSTNGHLEVIRPKLFAKTKTVLNKNETERQVVERWTELDNGQTDKGEHKQVRQKKNQSEDRHSYVYRSEERHFEDGQEEFGNGQIENGQQKQVGQKTKQSEDRHSNIYHSEERQLENGQFEDGQHDVGHLGKGKPEVKVVLKRLRFLNCSGKTFLQYYFDSNIVKSTSKWNYNLKKIS